MNLKNINTKFAIDFLDAMSNKEGGQSLRKWLSVGSFWVMAFISVKFTTEKELVLVLGVWAGLITALVITYTTGNVKEKKINAESKLNEDAKN